MKINHFNLVVLPAMIGIGIDNSVHLYQRYLEEGLGSLYFVLKKTGVVVLVTSLTSMAGFFGLAFSSHQGQFQWRNPEINPYIARDEMRNTVTSRYWDVAMAKGHA